MLLTDPEKRELIFDAFSQFLRRKENRERFPEMARAWKHAIRLSFGLTVLIVCSGIGLIASIFYALRVVIEIF